MQLFNLEVALANFGPLLAGLLMTVELTLVVIVLSLVFALLVALGGLSRFTPLRWLVKSYVEVMRGTPLLLQLIYVYYVLPEIGIRLDSFTAGVIALTLNYSAYLSEVYRGGIEAIARGQHDAAAALGMTGALAMRQQERIAFHPKYAARVSLRQARSGVVSRRRTGVTQSCEMRNNMGSRNTSSVRFAMLQM